MQSDHAEASGEPDPEGQGEGGDDGRDHDRAGRQCAIVSHLLCHDKAGDGGGGPEHDEDGNQLFCTESEEHGKREEQSLEADQLEEDRGQGGAQLTADFVKIDAGAHGNQTERAGGCGDVSDDLRGDGRKGEAEERPEKAGRDADEDGICKDGAHGAENE